MQVLRWRSPAALQHPSLPGSAPAWRGGSPTPHRSCCIEVHPVWPSQPLAISNLAWVHQQFTFVAFCFSYSVFPHQGWLKSTKSLPSQWVGLDCRGQGLLASDLPHSCYFCGEGGNGVSRTSQTTALLAVYSDLFLEDYLRVFSIFGNEFIALVYEEQEAAHRCACWFLLWLCFLLGFAPVQFSQGDGLLQVSGLLQETPSLSSTDYSSCLNGKALSMFLQVRKAKLKLQRRHLVKPRLWFIKRLVIS